MRTSIVLCFVVSVFLIDESIGRDLNLGESTGRQVIYHTSVQYPAFPNGRRYKYVTYTSIDLRKISGITATDHLQSDAGINVLAGGVDYPFVVLKVRSERGKGLDYDIKIYS